MKNFNKLALIALVLLIIPASAFGWSYRFVNNTPDYLYVFVYGEHLFWEQMDGKAIIPAGKSHVIDMPGGICGTFFRYTQKLTIDNVRYEVDTRTGVGSDAWGASCWNNQIAISFDKVSKKWSVTRGSF